MSVVLDSDKYEKTYLHDSSKKIRIREMSKLCSFLFQNIYEQTSFREFFVDNIDSVQ